MQTRSRAAETALPLLRPYIELCIVLGVIYLLNTYDQVFTNLTLTAGPHRFEYRTHTGGACVSNNWDKSLGFGVDPLARGPSDDTNNFYTVVDPGDGSIFSRSIDEADLPHFDEMRLAPGTTLDVNGNGRTDVVSGNWFSKETWWIENLLPSTNIWTQHLIEKTGHIETGILVDIDGDGKATDFLPSPT